MRNPIGELLARYDRRVPRYTSYPTAPHFGPPVGPAAYRRWLAALDPAVVPALAEGGVARAARAVFDRYLNPSETRHARAV